MSFIQQFFQKLLGPKHSKKAIVYYGEYSFSTIPIDLGAYVLSFLSFRDILQISLVSKHYYQICSSSMLWEQYCAQTWINTVLKNPARAEFEQKMLLAAIEASQQTAPTASASAGGAGGSTTASAAASTTTAAPGASTTVTVAPVVPVTAPPVTSSPLQQKLSRASSFFGKLGRTSSSNNMSQQSQASSSASPVTSPTTSSSALKLAQQEEMLLARQRQMQQAATMNSVKRFLESLQSMHSENFNWRDSYVNTKPILFSNSARDEEDPCGLFYFLGCYEPRIKITHKEKNSSVPTSPVTPLRTHSASNLFKAFTHSLHHSASASTLSPSGSASPSMAGSSSSSNFSAQGSVNRKDKYTNPAIISENSLHRVRITSSSQKVGKTSSWISRKQSACWTENNKYSYFQIDLGKFMKFIPTHYRMRYGSKSWKVLPRNWDFLGSNDGVNWKVIRSHHEDDTFKKQDYAPASWLVDQKTSADVFGEAFRYFRIVLTDRTASQHPEWEYVLVVTGVEFFGFLLMSPQYDEYIRMLNETKTTELICSIAQKESMTKIKSLVCNWFEKHFKISDPITPFGETLLHIAAQYNYTDCVHWLVAEKGADISALTDSGHSIYEVTKNVELKDMIHQFQISQLNHSMKHLGKDLNQKIERQSEEIQQLRDMVMFLMQQQKQASSKLQLPPSPKPTPIKKAAAQDEDDDIEVVPVMAVEVIADFREEKDEKII